MERESGRWLENAKEILISPRERVGVEDLKDVVRYHELLFFLTWRDIKVRYKQSVLGVAWVLLKPLATMAIFTVIFGRIAKLPSDGAPYPVFVLAGLVPWSFFASALGDSTMSVVSGGRLISKVYFPRIIVPMGAALSQMVDLVISFALLLIVMAAYGVHPGMKAAWVPLLFIFTTVAALGPGLLFSALFVKYRDVGHLIPFVVQIWMYVTPVIYPAGFVPEGYRWVLYLNPMTGVVETFRACLLPGKPFDLGLILASGCVSVTMFAVGAYYFRRVERGFADVI